MHSTHDDVELHLVVRDLEPAADDVVVVTLADPGGGVLPAWTPGSHTDVLLADGLVRQYSLCGDPGDRSTWTIAVLLEEDSRGGSRYVHERLAPGVVLQVIGPRNHFVLEPAPRYLFIAGGIGITPIVPMLQAAEAAGADWRLVYGGRRRASMAFGDALVSRYGSRIQLKPEDETGLLPLSDLLGTPDPGTLVYCCGPEPLLVAAEEACAGWPAGALHVERFSPREVGDPVLSAGFEVELATSGMVLTVPPERSILDVVEEAGVQVLSSCQEGTCGTCETAVLEGEPEHRDSLLTPEEQAAGDTMFICVSRSRSERLVLDL
jgi:ferredoxin-NADP reductase